jgi:hypothetical protein
MKALVSVSVVERVLNWCCFGLGAVFKDAFDFVFVSPHPRGSEAGSRLPLSLGTVGFRPIPAQIQGKTYFQFLFWALCAAGMSNLEPGARAQRHALDGLSARNEGPKRDPDQESSFSTPEPYS